MQTLRTAGRTIVFSAVTVALALAALLVFPPFFLRSFAYAGIAVVTIALLSAVVVLPAILMLLGHNVNRWKIPRISVAGDESKFWHSLAVRVTKRPIISALPVLLVIGVLAAPVLGITFASPNDQVLPKDASGHVVGDALRDDFATANNTALHSILVGDASDTDLIGYATEASKVANVQSVMTSVGTFRSGELVVPPAPDSSKYRVTGASYVEIVGPADFISDESQAIVHDVRALVPPAGTSTSLGGASPNLVDQKAAISDHLPTAAIWIVVSTFVLLFAFTGSVLLPIKALVLNGLTLAAVLGAMTWVFQSGHLAGLLDFTARPLDTSMPVLLFCVAFGLSMDYEIFVLSRIKEAHDKGVPDAEAVVAGIGRTGRIVTTAAGLLAVSFLAFGTSKVSFIQFFGIGTALAIVLDATLVRGVLVPAFMRLAGRANWWAPKSLRRAHSKIGIREA